MKKILILISLTIATILLINQGITMVTIEKKVIHDDVIGTVHKLETPAKYDDSKLHYLSTSPKSENGVQAKEMVYTDFKN